MPARPSSPNNLKSSTLSDNNPKTAAGQYKPRLHAIPTSAILEVGMAMQDGEKKYGLYNWRDKPISSSVYYDAMFRHLLLWWEREETDPQTNIKHLAYVAANAMILLDAFNKISVYDDRPTNPIYLSEIIHFMSKRAMQQDETKETENE